MEVKANKPERLSLNLHELLTNSMRFSDVDLVRNFQVIPEQIKTLKRSTLSDLVFVSNTSSLLENATNLNNITQTFLDQWKRVSLYYKSKDVAKELNITFEEVVRLSNLTIDGLLNSRFNVLEKIRKVFYTNIWLEKLQAYQKILLSYNRDILITIDRKKVEKHFENLTSKRVKELKESVLKSLLVAENKRAFIEDITVQNVSVFFNINISQIENLTVIAILENIFYIGGMEYASMYNLTSEHLVVLKLERLSKVPNSKFHSLHSITDKILKSQGKVPLFNNRMFFYLHIDHGTMVCPHLDKAILVDYFAIYLVKNFLATPFFKNN